MAGPTFPQKLLVGAPVHALSANLPFRGNGYATLQPLPVFSATAISVRYFQKLKNTAHKNGCEVSLRVFHTLLEVLAIRNVTHSKINSSGNTHTRSPALSQQNSMTLDLLITVAFILGLNPVKPLCLSCR